MEIKTKKIINLAVLGIISAGLASCSSSPAPWTQSDDSPWQSKRDTETQALPSDDAISDSTYRDPVLLADPEPEPIIIAEPDPAPAPEMITPVVVEEAMTPEQEIMSMPGSNYAVQLLATSSADKADKFKTDNGLDGLMVVATDRSGSMVYVVVDIHPDRASANAAASDLEARTGSKPWVRSVAGLQKVVAQ
jgi:septal ring-binding cell division protein DamX